jgi:hypothetical protein
MTDKEHVSKSQAIYSVALLICLTVVASLFVREISVFFVIEFCLMCIILFRIVYGFAIFEITNKEIYKSSSDYVTKEYALWKYGAVIAYCGSVIFLLYHQAELFCASTLATYIFFWLTNWYTIRYQKKVLSKDNLTGEDLDFVKRNITRVEEFRDSENKMACMIYAASFAIILVLPWIDYYCFGNCHIAELYFAIRGKNIFYNNCFLVFPSSHEGPLAMLAGVAIAHTFLSTRKFADYFSTTSSK